MKQNTITRSNNFDFLRLLFASLVIVSHSFPLTGQPEIAGVFTNDQLSLGSLSVDCFFIMSGYLIFQSLERSKTLLSYLWKRILRLFPALFILLIITLLILPFLYNGADISKESSYWSYLPNGLSLYRIQYNVNGVFENNLYPKAINGSLWSLSYEFTLYLILMIIFPFRENKNIVRIIMIIIFYLPTVRSIRSSPISSFCTASATITVSFVLIAVLLLNLIFLFTTLLFLY